MEKIQHQKHTEETFYFALSRMFERASFYGFRALMVLYMIGETLKMNQTDAISIYGWFTGSLIFSQIIGALFGDLLIGNKKAIIIGGIIQAVGAFMLCIPSTIGLYLGLILFVLGSGFYTPNTIANFGKIYLNKTKLLDSGFTIFYFVVNLGALLGVLLIGSIAETFGYNIGFVVSGILMLVAIIPILISKDNKEFKIEKHEFSLDKRILNISVALIAVGLFWAIYEISNIRIYDLQIEFGEMQALTMSKVVWQSTASIISLPIGLLAVFLWTYLYSSPFFKLAVGFIFGILSFGMLFFIPEIPSEQHVVFYLTSLIFLAISEIHIAPIIHSVLTKYANPKYLAILISLAFLPTKLISLFFGLFSNRIYDEPLLGIKIGIIGMTIIAIGISGFVWWNEKSSKNN